METCRICCQIPKPKIYSLLNSFYFILLNLTQFPCGPSGSLSRGPTSLASFRFPRSCSFDKLRPRGMVSFCRLTYYLQVNIRGNVFFGLYTLFFTTGLYFQPNTKLVVIRFYTWFFKCKGLYWKLKLTIHGRSIITLQNGILSRQLANVFYKHWDWNVKDKMDNRKYDNCKCHTMHFVDPFTRSGETYNYERNCSMINLHTWVRRGVKQAVQTRFKFYCGCTDASWFRNHGRKIFWLLLFRLFPSTALFLQIRL